MKLAPVRSAKVRSPLIKAPVRLAPVRFAPLRLTSRRSAPLKSQPLRSAKGSMAVQSFVALGEVVELMAGVGVGEAAALPPLQPTIRVEVRARAASSRIVFTESGYLPSWSS